MMDLTPFVAAWLLGFAGSGHCMGMCGGIIGALSLRPGQLPVGPQGRLLRVLAYNSGRIFSYAVMGTLAAALLSGVEPGGWPLLRTLAALLLFFMGLHFLGWRAGLQQIERVGLGLWRRLQPLNRRLMKSNGVVGALFLGILWGWLPCGLVYSALAYAAAQGDAVAGGVTMLAFGLGTAPSLVITGYFSSSIKQWLNRRSVTWLIGVFYILFAAWTLAAPWSHMLLHGQQNEAGTSDLDSGHHHMH